MSELSLEGIDLASFIDSYNRDSIWGVNIADNPLYYKALGPNHKRTLRIITGPNIIDVDLRVIGERTVGDIYHVASIELHLENTDSKIHTYVSTKARTENKPKSITLPLEKLVMVSSDSDRAKMIIALGDLLARIYDSSDTININGFNEMFKDDDFTMKTESTYTLEMKNTIILAKICGRMRIISAGEMEEKWTRISEAEPIPKYFWDMSEALQLSKEIERTTSPLFKEINVEEMTTEEIQDKLQKIKHDKNIFIKELKRRDKCIDIANHQLNDEKD